MQEIKTRLKRKTLPSQKVLRNLFEYKKDGSFVRKIKTSPSTFIGQNVTGCAHHKGYYILRVNNCTFQMHRIVWQWHFGKTPDYIDHINQVKNDNRIENLRAADVVKNSYNAALFKNNKLGVRGLCFDKKDKIYYGAIKVNGKRFKFAYSKNKKVTEKLLIQKQKEVMGVFFGSN